MNDNLVLQIETYDKIYDYRDKWLFVQKLLHYYKHTPYTSKDKEYAVPIGINHRIYIRFPLGNIPSKAPSYVVVVATRGAILSA